MTVILEIILDSVIDTQDFHGFLLSLMKYHQGLNIYFRTETPPLALQNLTPRPQDIFILHFNDSSISPTHAISYHCYLTHPLDLSPTSVYAVSHSSPATNTTTTTTTNTTNTKYPQVIITGLCKDTVKYMSSVMTNIYKIADHYESYKIIIFENGSTDGTREKLIEYASKDSDLIILGRDAVTNNHLSTCHDRVKRITAIRNWLLESAEEHITTDECHLVMIDMDEVLTHLEGYETCLTDFRGKTWDAIFPISDGLYYDIFALRDKEVKADCWQEVNKRMKEGGSSQEVLEDLIYRHQRDLRGQVPWCWRVDSAFNGMGVYKAAAIRGKRYKTSLEAGCEHVLFNQQLANKWINTRLRVAECPVHCAGRRAGHYPTLDEMLDRQAEPSEYQDTLILERLFNKGWVFQMPKQPAAHPLARHNNDSFRELPLLSLKHHRDVRIVTSDNPALIHCQLGRRVILYDRPTLQWADPGSLQDISLILFGNGSIDHEIAQLRARGHKVLPWIFWARHPRMVEKILDKVGIISSYSKRKTNTIFIGNYENSVQQKYRTGQDWSKYIDEFHCTAGGRHVFKPEKYLMKLRSARFGLCLRGFGSKCHREVELMAFGTIPLVTPDVSITDYLDPPIEGTHFLRVNKPEDIPTIISTITPEKWEAMSQAAHQWYIRNCHSRNFLHQTLKYALVVKSGKS